MTRIAFKVNQFSYRGSENAIKLYSRYAKEVLYCKVATVCPRGYQYHRNANGQLDHCPAVEAAFRSMGNFYEYASQDDLEQYLIENDYEYLYILKSGEKEGIVKLKTDKVKLLIHCVFTCSPEHKHGYKYVPIAPDIVKGYGSDGGHSNTKIFPTHPVPHIVERLPEPQDPGKFREDNSIPKDAIVYGRYGGPESFDLPLAHSAIEKYLVSDDSGTKKSYFIFMGTNRMHFNHPRVLYFPSSTNSYVKGAFVHACDYMLHARIIGESFGLAIGEFSNAGKPVITYNTKVRAHPAEHRTHIKILKNQGIYYDSEESLIGIFKKVAESDSTIARDPRKIKLVYDQYISEHRVMELFKEVFLNHITREMVTHSFPMGDFTHMKSNDTVTGYVPGEISTDGLPSGAGYPTDKSATIPCTPRLYLFKLMALARALMSRECTIRGDDQKDRLNSFRKSSAVVFGDPCGLAAVPLSKIFHNVTSYEPQPSNHAELEYNTYNLENVVVYNMMVGTTACTRHVSKLNNSWYGYVITDQPGPNNIPVTQIAYNDVPIPDLLVIGDQFNMDDYISYTQKTGDVPIIIHSAYASKNIKADDRYTTWIFRNGMNETHMSIPKAFSFEDIIVPYSKYVNSDYPDILYTFSDRHPNPSPELSTVGIISEIQKTDSGYFKSLISEKMLKKRVYYVHVPEGYEFPCYKTGFCDIQSVTHESNADESKIPDYTFRLNPVYGFILFSESGNEHKYEFTNADLIIGYVLYDLHHKPVINMDSHFDRWVMFKSRASGKGVKYFTRSPAYCPDENYKEDKVYQYLFSWNRNVNKGAFGCAMSHILEMKKAISLKQPMLIFEDDVEFTDPNFMNTLAKQLMCVCRVKTEKESEIISKDTFIEGRGCVLSKQINYSEYIYYPGYHHETKTNAHCVEILPGLQVQNYCIDLHGGTHSYAISQGAMESFMTVLEKSLPAYAIDYQLYYTANKDNSVPVYYSDPKITSAYNFYSETDGGDSSKTCIQNPNVHSTNLIKNIDLS